MEAGLWIAVLALATALIGACAKLVAQHSAVLLRIIERQEAIINTERKRADEAHKQALSSFDLALEQIRLYTQTGGRS